MTQAAEELPPESSKLPTKKTASASLKFCRQTSTRRVMTFMKNGLPRQRHASQKSMTDGEVLPGEEVRAGLRSQLVR